MIRTDSPQDRIKTKDLFEEFKRRTDPGTSFREFSQALGRLGLSKINPKNVPYIIQIKLKNVIDTTDFIED